MIMRSNMYGMINRFLQQLIIKEYGREHWNKIADETNLSTLFFMAVKQYPDSITYEIVQSASKILDIKVTDLLYLAGERWVDYTLETEFSYVYNIFGNDLFTFLKNLDNLHLNIGNVMPELKPPSFKSTDITTNSLKLHYYSDRVGLHPFVEGLIVGLAEHFNQSVQVQLVAPKSTNNDHDIFLVKLKTKD